MAYDTASFQAGIAAGRALRGRRPGATGGGDITEFEKAMTAASIEMAVVSSITMLAYLDFKSFTDKGTNWELRIVSQSALKVKQGWDECFIMPPTMLTLPDTPEYPAIVTMPDISGAYTVKADRGFTLSRRTNSLDGVTFSEKDNGTKRELVYKGTAYRMALTGAGWEADSADMLWTMKAPIFIPYMRTREA